MFTIFANILLLIRTISSSMWLLL